MTTTTFTQYLLEGCGEEGHDFARILAAVAVAVKRTATVISKGGMILDAASGGVQDPSRLGRNARRQARLLLLDEAAGVEQLAAVSFAGVDSIEDLGRSSARYLLTAEPLHRSASLGDNQPTGLVFSILERVPGQPCTAADFLQPGRRMVCAGIAVYGPITMLILTTGQGVSAFTHDRESGDLVLTGADLQVLAESPGFAINASEEQYWPAAVKRYVDECVRGSDGPRGRDFVMRWNASAVLGVYRILLNGGLFLVPRTSRPDGAWGVPLIHNAAPLAWIMEQAGGGATTGRLPILDVQPASLTERSALICGTAGEVSRIITYFEEADSHDPALPSYPLFGTRSLFKQEG